MAPSPQEASGVQDKDIGTVVERVLTDSVEEFTQPGDTHPGCLISSAAMTDSTDTLGTTACFAELHGWNEQTLLARVERAVRDGELTAQTNAAAVTGLVQSDWHGLSVRSNLGTPREDLIEAAQLGHRLICRHPASARP
ncbi:hypothetical protein ACYF6T_29885 [Streptomyces sp. 7R007]